MMELLDQYQSTAITVDETSITYSYNGDGLMVGRTKGSEATRYYYDDRGLLVAEGMVNAGAVSITYGYLFDSTGKLVGSQSAGESKLQYYVTNGHGDVTELRDASGNLLNSYSYDIWDNPATVQETVPNALRYSGEYWDADTGLQYLRARWYDPATARFIGEDTYEGEMMNPLTLNLYTYVTNNPLIYTDPTGHEHRVEGGSGGGGGNIRVPKWLTWGNGSKKPLIKPSTNPKSPQVKITTNSVIKNNFTNNQFQKEILNEKAYYRASTKAKGTPKAKYTTNNLPKDPKELINNGWKDTTPEGMAKNTSSREYIDPVTGMKVRFAPGKPGANGFEGKDHYHIHNPNSTGKNDYYIDANGNPVAKGSKASHIIP